MASSFDTSSGLRIDGQKVHFFEPTENSVGRPSRAPSFELNYICLWFLSTNSYSPCWQRLTAYVGSKVWKKKRFQFNWVKCFQSQFMIIVLKYSVNAILTLESWDKTKSVRSFFGLISFLPLQRYLSIQVTENETQHEEKSDAVCCKCWRNTVLECWTLEVRLFL